MKASLALILAGALSAAASPLDKRVLEVKHDVTTVTQYVYPDGSPATHMGAGPTDGPDTAVVFFNERKGGRKGDRPQVQPQEQPQEQPAPTPAPVPQPQPEEQKQEPEPQPAPVVQEPVAEPVAAPVQSGSDVRGVSLNAHNMHRANHSSSDVQWDSDLANSAQILANSCVYDHDMNIGGGGYGQNIAMRAATSNLEDAPAAARLAITGYWYNDEFNDYPGFGKDISTDDGVFKDWGHLSQMVWSETTHIGCAIAICDAGTMNRMKGWFAVCNYKPQGNFRGKFAQNVKAPLGMATAQV